MFRKIEDFTHVWEYETQSTIKLYSRLTDEVLNQHMYEGGRSVLRLVAHINETLTEMLHQAGLPIDENKTVYTSKSELIEQYAKDAALVKDIVTKHWTDAQLEDEVPMYGMKWNKGTVLFILITHQTHHRAQLSVLMQQAGLSSVGVYGPTHEEWVAMGREPLI